MTNEAATFQKKSPIIIKKYTNRRLYNTSNSAYVTLEDLAGLVKAGDDFIVCDAKTSEDITRSVLTQIIFEQENKNSQNLLPIAFLRQLIRFYGDSVQSLVPSYLQFSLERFTADQQILRDQLSQSFKRSPFASPTSSAFSAIEEQTRKNLVLFQEALNLFNPFRHIGEENSVVTENGVGDTIDSIKQELLALQKRLDLLDRQEAAFDKPKPILDT